MRPSATTPTSPESVRQICACSPDRDASSMHIDAATSDPIVTPALDALKPHRFVVTSRVRLSVVFARTVTHNSFAAAAAAENTALVL